MFSDYVIEFLLTELGYRTKWKLSRINAFSITDIQYDEKQNKI